MEEISEIHTSVWPALFDSGIITLEPNESEQAQGKEDQEMTLRTLGYTKKQLHKKNKKKLAWNRYTKNKCSKYNNIMNCY